MLWYKGWLETRVRVIVALGWIALLLYSLHLIALKPASGSKPAASLVVLVNLFAVAVSSMFPGAGIHTRSGSTLFTVALPLSRLRLLLVRASLGWLEMSGLIVIFCLGSWFLFPLAGAATPLELAEHAATLIGCFSGLYFLSVLLATFLDPSWRVAGSLLAFTAVWLLSIYAHPPSSVDLYWAMQDGSPLLTHSIPWSTIVFSLALAAILFFAALKIVQRREY